MDKKASEEQRLPAEGTMRRIIYDCIVALHSANRQASRQVIASETSLKFSIVDDHVKRLKDDGLIRLVVNGVFEPVDIEPDRAVSATFVPRGKVKLEIGETVLDLTMREARAVAMATGGILLVFGR